MVGTIKKKPGRGKDPHDRGGIKKIKWDRSGKPRQNLDPTDRKVEPDDGT